MGAVARRDSTNPLIESAPLAQSWARRLCRSLPGETCCADYHGLRQYWRLLDLVTTPGHHDFYADHIGPPVSAGCIGHVLISGCADYAQLAQIAGICGERERLPEISVVDRCETPLALCRWYARREGFSIDTHAADIRRFRPRRSVDLVCTHSFLTWFAPRERPEIVSKWFELLRPGGTVLTVTRLRPPSDSPDSLVADDEKEARAFCALVLERAKQRPGLIDATPGQLMDWARRYRSGKTSYGIRSRSGLEAVFRSAGFQVQTVNLGTVPRPEWRRERDAQGAVSYIGVIATRPE